MPRVAGTDPGTSALDVLILADGAVADQQRFTPAQLRADPAAPIQWLQERGPFDLVAAPSGYGLPLVAGRDCTDEDLRLLSLVRDEERQPGGVAGFSQLVRAFRASTLPVCFLPGVIHLPTVAAQRKINRIDLGTADKVCVAALAIALAGSSACIVELGSAFTACVVVRDGQIVDGRGGTAGALGWRSGGTWDGELAYLLSPLKKTDLFRGGVEDIPDREVALLAFRESLVDTVAGLLAITPCERIVLSGQLLVNQAEWIGMVEADLARLAPVARLGALPGAWVKHAAQGAAVLADGLVGGQWHALVECLRLREAAGSVLDGVVHPRRGEVRVGNA